MKMTISAILPVLTAALCACTPVATYPPGFVVNPEAVVNEPVPSLMVVAIDYADSRYGYEDDPAINLPPGTPLKLYAKVIKGLGEGHPMRDPHEPAYHIVEVRARGLKGEVDLFIPNVDGTYGFATMTFRRDAFRGYEHERTRWWRSGDEPPPPNYAVLPDEPEKPVPGPPVLASD